MDLIEMIVVDLDGTLLTSNSSISKRNLEALKAAVELGIEVVIATGRGHFDVRNLLRHTNLSPWIIGANGATIHKPDRSCFLTFPLEKKQAISILKWLEENDYYYEVFSEKAIFTPENGRRLIEIELDRLKNSNTDKSLAELRHSANEQFKQFGFEFVSGYEEIVKKNVPVYNILAFSFDDEKLKKGQELFSAHKELNVVNSGYHNFEIEDYRASKGNALALLAENLHISMANVLAIGDSLNDVSMLKISGISIAMKNASKEVMEICREKTDSNDSDGVGKAIERFLDI